MNKNELIERVAVKTGMTKAVASEAVEAMLETISCSLEHGEEVKLVGFGSFRITERKPSTGRNPRTGEVIDIAAVRNIKFRQGTDLRERINGSKSA